MPFAVALLAHPVGAYAFLVIGIATLVYGAHARRFVPLFAGTSSALLACLAFLHARPSAASLALLALAVVLMHAEFRCATRGALGALGLVAATWGSWLALGIGAPLPSAPARLAIALAGAAGLLLAVGAALRRATLPRQARTG